jgi:EAL domain-containing protein (putative c-di-GMP-specific phosphodiesterase class I)
LVKPVDSSRLEEVVNKAVQMAQMARIRRLALEVAHATADPDLRPAYESALRGMWIAYQPIVSASDGTLYGHEALMRVSARNIAHPGHMLDAAERLNELIGLGRHVRQLAVAPVMEVPEAGVLFVNLHPHELSDEQLADPDAALSQIAGRVVLEITERHSVSNLNDLRTTVARLRELGFRIAVDDLGAGYAGLTSFALLEPDIVKIDMSLVRDIDKVPVKQRLVRSITSLCLDMNIRVVGEGVETAPELETLRELGCDLVQGYLLARPDRPFPAINWPLS